VGTRQPCAPSRCLFRHQTGNPRAPTANPAKRGRFPHIQILNVKGADIPEARLILAQASALSSQVQCSTDLGPFFQIDISRSERISNPWVSSPRKPPLASKGDRCEREPREQRRVPRLLLRGRHRHQPPPPWPRQKNGPLPRGEPLPMTEGAVITPFFHDALSASGSSSEMCCA